MIFIGRTGAKHLIAALLVSESVSELSLVTGEFTNDSVTYAHFDFIFARPAASFASRKARKRAA